MAIPADRPQLVSVVQPNGDATSYTYNAAGLQTSLTDGEDNTTVFVYDGLNRLIEPRSGTRCLT